VAAGIGEPQDFPDNTSGSIALIERGILTFGEKVANAQAAGAIGVAVYNNASGPFEGSLGDGEPVDVPVVALPREDGLALLDVLDGGASGRLVVETSVSNATSYNVLARAEGADCRVVAGGHYDSVPAGPGANDNGSGTATAMEIARVLAARGETAHVCFALFGSEEIGLVGSALYVSQLSQDERSAIIGMLNFDMFGVGSDWSFIGSDSMTTLASQAADALGIPHRIELAPPNVGSDHASFVDNGVPAILFNCFCDPNYHTAADRFEFIRPERLEEAGNIGLEMTEAMLEDVGG
jgi:aminopeptidase YwaD